jgi:hypothetical protein
LLVSSILVGGDEPFRPSKRPIGRSEPIFSLTGPANSYR